MKCALYLMVCFFLMKFVTGFPSQCKDDKYFDRQKQIYLPCSKCEDNQMECQICCSASKPEGDSLDTPMSSSTEAPVSSMKEKSDKSEYHILNIFFQSFIITMVMCTLLTLVYVAYKNNHERQAAECRPGNHFHNAYANMVQEVLTIDPPTAAQSDMHQSTCQKSSSHVVNKAVNAVPEVDAKSSVTL